MLVHHLFRGKEEETLRVLEAIGAGKLGESPKGIRTAVPNLLANNASLLLAMMRKLALHERITGASGFCRSRTEVFQAFNLRDPTECRHPASEPPLPSTI